MKNLYSLIKTIGDDHADMVPPSFWGAFFQHEQTMTDGWNPRDPNGVVLIDFSVVSIALDQDTENPWHFIFRSPQLWKEFCNSKTPMVCLNYTEINTWHSREAQWLFDQIKTLGFTDRFYHIAESEISADRGRQIYPDIKLGWLDIWERGTVSLQLDRNCAKPKDAKRFLMPSMRLSAARLWILLEMHRLKMIDRSSISFFMASAWQTPGPGGSISVKQHQLLDYLTEGISRETAQEWLIRLGNTRLRLPLRLREERQKNPLYFHYYNLYGARTETMPRYHWHVPISIVPETMASYDASHNTQITEKTYRGIACGQAQILHAPPGTVQNLRKLGYTTWNSIWDESYDSVEDWQLRGTQLLETANSITDAQLAQAQEINRHNQQVQLQRTTYTELLRGLPEFLHSLLLDEQTLKDKLAVSNDLESHHSNEP